jgi:hypothetical protein
LDCFSFFEDFTARFVFDFIDLFATISCYTLCIYFFFAHHHTSHFSYSNAFFSNKIESVYLNVSYTHIQWNRQQKPKKRRKQM